jgi:hypothetical protein
VSARWPALASFPERMGPVLDLGITAAGGSVVALRLGAGSTDEGETTAGRLENLGSLTAASLEVLGGGWVAAGPLETLVSLTAASLESLAKGLTAAGPLETLGSFGWGSFDPFET